MGEEDLAATERGCLFGGVVILKLDQRHCVGTEPVLLHEERHKDAVHAEHQIVGVGSVPYVVGETERHLALHAVGAGDLPYLVNLVFLYH